ncbi:antirestriction protein ArdR [Pseudomonas aeruginosa]|uniref:antirestriction protein ArdR n=1 Tax=Pseudomonas aeruginosa TaxID=287 RepID=UPI001A331A11|nr:antirestriction protein ArdR [Pseudomonas aeruginosa]MBH9237843.1 antirestriction protein ArdR [Pseudomonas aeruginosa]MBO8406819.1 antirestriction protein ArdR [Pseudomonas aeruginosa]MCO1999736.1 antirestriction protein ArdR [Pseudomonas aeruginosa]HEJ1164902.1 antirestriction protein ArdR [Pseudomonas aeruginosa]HEJ4993812.1 antirestriction protein ArdR [Pseudomonas aeruginosa]
MSQLIEALRATATKWRAANQEHRGGVVLLWEGEVYGWKNELRDPASESPGAYAVDKTGLVFKAEGGDAYNGAKAWVAVDPDAQ